MAWDGPSTLFLRWQGPAWTHIKGRAIGYPQITDHGRYDAIELAGPKKDPSMTVVGENAGEKTRVARRNRAGK